MTEPTPDQTLAIETTDRALFVEAGAGTGKTWVLVKRFIYLLQLHPDWPVDSIWAVTFTEKAAREMRSRIRKAVEQMADQYPEDSHWQERRHSLDRLQVGTLHSLCARLLREHAIAARLDPRFSVLDEQEAGLLQEQAIQAALNELVDQGSPALSLLAALRVADLRSQLAVLLSQRGTVHRLFPGCADPEGLLERWRQGIQDMHATLCRATCLDPELSGAISFLSTVAILDPTDRLAPSVEAARAGWECLQRNDFPGCVSSWGSINRTGGRDANWKSGASAVKEALKLPQEKAKSFKNLAVQLGAGDRAAALALQQWAALWSHLEGVYRRYKDERNTLDFDDLELYTEELLAARPRDPRLQAALDGLRHLMVDEFQDTNAAQQNIVYALAHPAQPGKLFVVGDAKQSIYRFRQAQVTVFNRTGSDIQAVSGHPPVRLGRSFRTHTALVAAMNDLFAHVLQPEAGGPADFEAAPGPLEAERLTPPHSPVNHTSGLAAPVEVVLLPAVMAEGSRVSAEDARIFEARWLGQRMLELHASQFPVWDRAQQGYRPFRFSDAAILFRATTNLPLYEEQFKALGLPYLTVSGRGYYDRPEIRDLVALLSCLYNPADDLSLATVLRSPLFGLSDESLYRLRWRTPQDQRSPEPVPYRQALASPPPNDQQQEMQFAHQVMSELWSKTGRLDLWRLLRLALDRTGYEALLALTDQGLNGNAATGRQLSNVQKFLALARDQAGTGLSGFLHSIQDLRAREAREGEALGSAPESGAVQLMSIHAAKGLEFPVVAVADLGREKNRQGESPRILHDPAVGLVCKQRNEQGDWEEPASYKWAQWMLRRLDEAENKRLLYVACTRAADLLILSGRVGKKESWLANILTSWKIADTGPGEEIHDRGNYSLRVFRLDDDEAGPPQESLPRSRDHLIAPMTSLPALALPLAPQAQPQPVAVTHALYRETENDEIVLPFIHRTAANPQQPETSAVYRAPSYRVGRLVHRALADWTCLSLSPSALAQRLRTYAHREGIFHPGAVEDAIQRARRMIDHLRHSQLLLEINNAAQSYRNIPFTVEDPAGTFYGVIDLLFCDPSGQWRLVDWRTEWVKGDLETAAGQHLLQMAIYVEAVRRTASIQPKVSLCFLNVPGARVYEFKSNQIQAALKEVFG